MAVGERVGQMAQPVKRRDLFSGPFFWLSAFYFVYCIRPEDWIPGLKNIPLAKATAFFAIVALLLSMGKVKRRFRDLPKESTYLLLLIGLMFLSAVFSPVWRGGAFFLGVDLLSSHEHRTPAAHNFHSSGLGGRDLYRLGYQRPLSASVGGCSGWHLLESE
jgi:hypothetical protein